MFFFSCFNSYIFFCPPLHLLFILHPFVCFFSFYLLLFVVCQIPLLLVWSGSALSQWLCSLFSTVDKCCIWRNISKQRSWFNKNQSNSKLSSSFLPSHTQLVSSLLLALLLPMEHIVCVHRLYTFFCMHSVYLTYSIQQLIRVQIDNRRDRHVQPIAS